MSKQKLKDYKDKRKLDETPEPSGQRGKIKDRNRPVFVVQKHNASSLHYDFRLEIDGVLVSWAVPKGPSTDPGQKRLAIPTEDHPLEYAKFEGVIPEDEYGGGEVIVWDTGKYENKKERSMSQTYKDGKVEVFLHGEKLKGEYALIRTGNNKEDNRWLLIKTDDKYADRKANLTKSKPESVLTGKTITSLKNEK